MILPRRGKGERVRGKGRRKNFSPHGIKPLFLNMDTYKGRFYQTRSAIKISVPEVKPLFLNMGFLFPFPLSPFPLLLIYDLARMLEPPVEALKCSEFAEAIIKQFK